MSTVDSFLLTLDSDKLNSKVPVRDKRILNSLARQLRSGVFLTENQGLLLIKILKENSHCMDIDTDIEDPSWTQSFRKVVPVKKIYLDQTKTMFVVEFSFNKRIKSIISELSKQVDGNVLNSSGKTATFLLTERNIFNVITALKNERFEIEPVISQYYYEISSIIEKNEQPYLFENLSDQIKSKISSEIDITDELLVCDRRLKYQYTMSTMPSTLGLTTAIAKRKSPRIFINNKTTSLTDVVASLFELQRFPILFVFNQHEIDEACPLLEKLAVALDQVCPSASVGIYFRFENGPDPNAATNKFNSLIKEKSFNCRLDSNTQIVGISNNQLPKFMFTANWRPKAIISFSTNFKGNKTSVFFDDTDLIIYYNEHAPLSLGSVDEIV